MKFQYENEITRPSVQDRKSWTLGYTISQYTISIPSISIHPSILYLEQWAYPRFYNRVYAANIENGAPAKTD